MPSADHGAAAPSTLSPAGRGQGEGAANRSSLSRSDGEGDRSAEPNGGGVMTDEDIDAGFAQMSKRFHDEGGELYVPTD